MFNSAKPGLFRCNVDTVNGSDCQHIDISAGQGSDSGWTPRIVVDKTNQNLLVVSLNIANSRKPGLFRCKLNTVDGSDCLHINVAGDLGVVGRNARITIDEKNSKIFIVTEDEYNFFKLSLFRCNLNIVDGSDCKYKDISAGQGIESGNSPSMVIDTVNGKLLTVTRNTANSARPGLFRLPIGYED
ncbi:MAG: hypothetical protein KDK45_12700 [Leptospiraceae bacterium]|nr:hypothetical protein [Leptospiraceae bacterium]